MKLYARFSNGRILPEYSTDYEKLGKIRPDTTYQVEITQPRNIGFHRRFFALLNLAYSSQNTFNNFDDMRDWLTMKAGFYRRVDTPTGEIFKPESISFASMDEIKFREVYNRVMDVICNWLDLTDEAIQNELINFM